MANRLQLHRSRKRRCAALISLLLAVPHSAALALPQGYDAAIAEARAGRTRPAAAALMAWHAEQPHEPRILHDLVVVLGWDGEYDAAAGYYAQVMRSNPPTYALKSLAYSCAMSGRHSKAEEAYRAVLRQSASDSDAQAGLVRALLDQSRPDDASPLLAQWLPAFPSNYLPAHVDLVFQLARLQEQRGDWLAAASAYQEALRLRPGSHDALRGQVFALSAAGLPHAAARLAAQRTNIFSEAELHRLQQQSAGRTVAFGKAVIASEKGTQRFSVTDSALSQNTAVQAAFGAQPASRFDRLVALRDRVRMNEAAALYESMLADGLRIPAYATAAAADAYLYLEQPERARDLYREAIRAMEESGEDTFTQRIALAYALVESEQHAEAQSVADQLLGKSPALRYRRVDGLEAPNSEYTEAALLSGLIMLYSDRLQQAERQIALLREKAPHHAEIRAARASLHLARQQPRAALDEFTLLAVDQPDLLNARTGQAEALLALNETIQARTILQPLLVEYPESKMVQRLTRRADLRSKPTLVASSSFGRSNAAVSAENTHDLRFYTAPLPDVASERFRLFTHVSHSSGKVATDAQPADREGRTIDRTRIGIGADYRSRDLTAEAQVNQANAVTRRGGIALRTDYALSDAWTFGVAMDTNVNNLPAVVFRNGGSGKSWQAGVAWQPHESKSIGLQTDYLRFSDGNLRSTVSLAWRQRWLSSPSFNLGSRLSLAASRNTRSDVAYFSPSSDREIAAGVDAQWLTWRRYDHFFQQRFLATFGSYRQSGFGSAGVGTLQYGHEWSLGEGFGLQYNIGRAFRSYDGQRDVFNYGSVAFNWAIQ